MAAKMSAMNDNEAALAVDLAGVVVELLAAAVVVPMLVVAA